MCVSEDGCAWVRGVFVLVFVCVCVCVCVCVHVWVCFTKKSLSTVDKSLER